MLKDSSSYCPDVFHNLYIEPINNHSVNVAACCQAQAHVVPLQFFSFSLDPGLTRLRESVEKSIKAPECDKCWSIEALGGRSRRHSVIDEYKDHESIGGPTSLDINVTWACNLACIMCGPQWSSTWAKEIGVRKNDLDQLGRQGQKNNDWIDRIDFSMVRRVHFNGGEPLLNNSHKTVLEKMRSLGTLSESSISYNTNGTQLVDEDTLDLWAEARLVKIYFSIDAVGDAFDYIRYPASWHTVEKNILRFKSLCPSNVMFGFNVTVGCYNVLELRSIWNWFSEHLATNREGDLSDFCWQPSNGFDVNKLNEPAKQAAILSITDLDHFDDLRSQLAMASDPDHGWIRYLDALDTRRNTNWRQSLCVDTYYRG